MEKVIQIVLVLMVLICIYHYAKSEATISLASYVKWEVPFWDESNSKNSSIYENNKLDIWMGRYGFTDTFEHNSGEINYFVDYEIIIYKDDGKYYAELEGNGWFLQTRSLAYVEGNENSIDIIFKSSLPGDSLYGKVERYDEDELMLTLSYDDSELISSWHVLRKEHPIFIESEEEIKGIYFEKLDQDSVSLLKLEEMLENNLFENVTFHNSEKAIVFYETNVSTPFEGYQIPIYRETSEKDILFEGTFLVEKDTGDIYIRGEKDWVLLKEGILKGLNLPDEPEDVFIHEYDGDNKVIVELLDKVFDFLKTKKEYANFKIKYDGAYSFLGRKYHSVSLIEDINDDMIHTLQHYSVDMETGDLYQESDSEERKELYYMGNLGTEQEAVEAGTEDIKYVDEVIPVQYTDDLSYLADMKYTNSTYVYQDSKVYYRRYHEDSYEETALWGEYDAIPETKKEMVCVDAKGIETVLFTDEGYGDIYLLNNRFYLTMAERKESAYGYTYTARCLYSVNMQGNDRIDYGEGYVFAIDKDRKIIIIQLRDESGICYYAVNYETGEKERLCFEYPFDSGAYQDGWFYYERHIGDDVTCKLCAVSLEGEEREIIVLTSDDNQVPNVREHISDIKVDENRIYFIFGGCDGSLQVFQGGKLISVKLDGTDYRAVETERDVFYLSHGKGKPLVYFVSHYNAQLNENDTMVWDVEENICYRSDFPADDLNYYEKSIDKDGSIYKNVERMWRYYPATIGSLYSVTRYDSGLRKQKEDIYAISDDSGRIVRVVTDIGQYITKWEEEEASYIDYEDFYFADGYLYFKVEYSIYDEGASIGWRDGLRRLHVDFYRLKIGEGKAEVLYSY